MPLNCLHNNINMSLQKGEKKIITAASKDTKKQALSTNNAEESADMLFNKNNFYFVFGGLVLMGIGFLLMSGGHMPSDDVWDENLIYSTRRVFVAPLVILSGLAVVIFAIFKK